MKQVLLSLFICLFYLGLTNAQVASTGNGLIAQNQTVGQGKLSIFPNPATDYIQLTDTDEVAEIIIYNVVGKRIISFEYLKDEKYQISDLPNGMYLVQFLGKNNKIISTKRLSKR